MISKDVLLAPMKSAVRREVGGAVVDIARAGDGRVKRTLYPPGFRWSTHMKPVVNTDFCMHAHVGFLAQGQIEIQFPDGCTFEFKAPQAIAIEPGHDGRVVGDEPAVLIEFDFERETIKRCGMPEGHRHAAMRKGS